MARADVAGFLVSEDGLVPKERYTSPSFAELEMDRLWSRVWQVACREEELAEPGDYIEYMVGDQSVLVVRTGSGNVQAFFNTCLHRGTRLASGCGTFAEGRIRCPYHAWCYGLDGRLADVPDREEFPPIPADLQLGEVRAEVWGGFVFVCLDRGARRCASSSSPCRRSWAPTAWQICVSARTGPRSSRPTGRP